MPGCRASPRWGRVAANQSGLLAAVAVGACLVARVLDPDGSVDVDVQAAAGIEGADQDVGHLLLEVGQGGVLVTGLVQGTAAVGFPEFRDLAVDIGDEPGDERVVGLGLVVPALVARGPVQRIAQRVQVHGAAAGASIAASSRISRSLRGWTGRLFGGMIAVKAASCPAEIPTRVGKTFQRTPSVPGGVVRDPS